GGISVEDIPVEAPVEDAGAGGLLLWKVGEIVVVADLAAGHLCLREGDGVVEVEVGAERGEPLEAPTHALLERGDFRVRGAGDGDEGDIAGVEVRDGAVEVVGEEGATGAPLGPAGSEHEVVDDELGAALEEV